MNTIEKGIEVIESETYGLEAFLNDVVKYENNTVLRETQTDGEKIYRYIKESM